MGSPYLNNNESILLSTHNIIINTIPAEAILTNQRLILIDARNTQLRPQDIPFTAVETVTIGDTSAMDPVLSLSVVLKDGTRHTLGIVFPQVPKTRRMGERDAWATKLKEAGVAAQKEQGIQPAELVPPWIAGDLPEEAGKGAEAADEKFYNPPLLPRKPRPQPSSGNRRTLVAAGLVIILVIACVAGVFFFLPSLAGNFMTTPGTVAAPEPAGTVPETPGVPEQPTVMITLQPEATPEVIPTATAAPQATKAVIPQETGVWVRFEYAGNYTATFGTAGRLREITGSGDQIYQVPAKNEIVDATVQKLDESGNVLTVSIYNNGDVAKSGSTSSPHGTVEIHADLRAASTAAANSTATA